MLNHLIDQLTDVAGITALGALDDFSDTLHDEIIIQGRAAGLTVELLDAKGDILFEQTLHPRRFHNGLAGRLPQSIEGVI